MSEIGGIRMKYDAKIQKHHDKMMRSLQVVCDAEKDIMKECAKEVYKGVLVQYINLVIDNCKEVLSKSRSDEERMNAAQFVLNNIDYLRAAVNLTEEERVYINKVYDFYAFLRDLYNPDYDDEMLKERAKIFGGYSVEDSKLRLEQKDAWDDTRSLIDDLENGLHPNL